MAHRCWGNSPNIIGLLKYKPSRQLRPTLSKLRQENCYEFKASLDHKAIACFR